MTIFDNELRLLGSDYDPVLWYKMEIYIKESILKKEWSTFLKTLPDNEDVQMFLIQVHFK